MVPTAMERDALYKGGKSDVDGECGDAKFNVVPTYVPIVSL